MKTKHLGETTPATAWTTNSAPHVLDVVLQTAGEPDNHICDIVDNISGNIEPAQERMGHALMVVSTITFSNRPASRARSIEGAIKIIKTNKKIRVISMMVGQPGAGDPVNCSAGSAVEGTDRTAPHRFPGAGRKEVSIA